jgi:uncharacterized protein (UPF0333 family)
MLKNKKQKAQVSAPFELLVAIIVMIFVIISGSYALSNLSENTCLGNKRQDFSNLISALNDVVFGSDLAYRTISFTTKACYNENYETVRLKIENERDICERYCGSGSSCVLLYYAYEDPDKLDYKHPIPPVCTYLPTNLIFDTNPAGNCDVDPNEGTLINPLTDNIRQGRYKLYRIASPTHYNICMVKTS